MVSLFSASITIVTSFAPRIYNNKRVSKQVQIACLLLNGGRSKLLIGTVVFEYLLSIVCNCFLRSTSFGSVLAEWFFFSFSLVCDWLCVCTRRPRWWRRRPPPPWSRWTTPRWKTRETCAHTLSIVFLCSRALHTHTHTQQARRWFTTWRSPTCSAANACRSAVCYCVLLR